MIAAETLIAGRYRVKSLLGGGATKQVYLAEDLHLGGRACALAEMTDPFLDSAERDEGVRGFRREAEVLAELNHEQIPRVYDFFTDRNHHYLAMEYVPGKTLERVLTENGGRLDEKRVIDLAVQIAATLEYLHGLNPPIVYRDLKPSNVIVTQDDRIKLIDFGIARHFLPHGTMTVLGTAGYAAPEQYEGRANPMSDVYALGALIHQMLSGRNPVLEPPFSFPPIAELCGCDLELAALVSSALQYSVGQRSPNAAEFRRNLRRIGDRRERNSVARPSVLAAASSRAKANRVAAAVVIGVLAAGLACYGVGKGRWRIWDKTSDPDQMLSIANATESRAPAAIPFDSGVDMTQSVEVGLFSYHVASVELQTWVGNTRNFLRSPPGCKFLLVSLAVINNGPVAQAQPNDNVEIIDRQSRIFRADREATRDNEWAHPSNFTYLDLDPGLSSIVTRVFILPRDALSSRLTLAIRPEKKSEAFRIALTIPSR